MQDRFVYRPWAQLRTLPNRSPAMSIIWLHISDVATISYSAAFHWFVIQASPEKITQITITIITILACNKQLLRRGGVRKNGTWGIA
jgi:hypothetical protein